MSRPVVIPILPRTELNGSYLGAGLTRTITLPTIEVSPYYYATLIVRLHDATWTSGAGFGVAGWASYPSSEDAREFLATTTSFMAQVTQALHSSGPAVATVAESDIPTAYKFIGTLTQGTGSAGLFAVVSADLMLRPA